VVRALLPDAWARERMVTALVKPHDTASAATSMCSRTV
jgi:hypothetical protein